MAALSTTPTRELFSKKGFGSWTGSRGQWQCTVNVWIERARSIASPHKAAVVEWLVPHVQGPARPQARTLHTATAYEDDLYVFGGWDGVQYFDDVHALNTVTWEWRKPITFSPPPTARIGHTATVVGSKIFVFGGHNDCKWFNDLYVLDVNTLVWSRPPVKGWAPPARRGHTATRVGTKIWVYGGYNYNARTCCSKVFNDVHVLDTETMAWDEVRTEGNAATGRWNHTTAAVGTKLYVFGGSHSNVHFNDLRVLDTQTLAWEQPETSGSPPEIRGHHTCESIGQFLVVFGGYDGETNRFADVHLLDTETMHWWTPQQSGRAPAPRSSHTATFVGTKMVIYGGYGGWINYFDDVCCLETASLLAAAAAAKAEDAALGEAAASPAPLERRSSAGPSPALAPALPRSSSARFAPGAAQSPRSVLGSGAADDDARLFRGPKVQTLVDALHAACDSRDTLLLEQPAKKLGDSLQAHLAAAAGLATPAAGRPPLTRSASSGSPMPGSEAATMDTREVLSEALAKATAASGPVPYDTMLFDGVGRVSGGGAVWEAVQRVAGEYARYRDTVARELEPRMRRTHALARELLLALQEETTVAERHAELAAAAEALPARLAAAASAVLHSVSLNGAHGLPPPAGPAAAPSPTPPLAPLNPAAIALAGSSTPGHGRSPRAAPRPGSGALPPISVIGTTPTRPGRASGSAEDLTAGDVPAPVLEGAPRPEGAVELAEALGPAGAAGVEALVGQLVDRMLGAHMETPDPATGSPALAPTGADVNGMVQQVVDTLVTGLHAPPPS